MDLLQETRWNPHTICLIYKCNLDNRWMIQLRIQWMRSEYLQCSIHKFFNGYALTHAHELTVISYNSWVIDICTVEWKSLRNLALGSVNAIGMLCFGIPTTVVFGSIVGPVYKHKHMNDAWLNILAMIYISLTCAFCALDWGLRTADWVREINFNEKWNSCDG